MDNCLSTFLDDSVLKEGCVQLNEDISNEQHACKIDT